MAALLSLVGLADAIYLTVEHRVGETAGCIVSRGCFEVRGGKYAAVGPVRWQLSARWLTLRRLAHLFSLFLNNGVPRLS
jgi:hypothetical protein